MLHIICLKFACSVTVYDRMDLSEICRCCSGGLSNIFLLRVYYFRDDRFVFRTVCSCIVDCCPSIHVETSRLVCCTLGSVDEADVILHENDTFTTLLMINTFKHYYLLVTLNGVLEPPD